MVDYSKLSDFEINCKVAKANNWTSKSFVHEIHSGKWNPCQNADDAWPIIADNKINIYFSSNDQMAQFYQHGRESVEAFSHNALRAAMIVFLMMQDANHG